MSYVYNWKLSGGRTMVVEYCYSTVTNDLKVVDMWLDGKFHSWSWVPQEGRSELLPLLFNHYNEQVGLLDRV